MMKKVSGYDLFISSYAGSSGSSALYRAYIGMDGTVHTVRKIADLRDPSFLQLNTKADILYAVCEYNDGASLSMFRVSERECVKIKECAFDGTGACHICYSEKQHSVFVSCYGSGDFYRFDAESLSCLAHYSAEQVSSFAESHGHCTVVDHTGRFLIYVDLGLDLISVFSLETRSTQPVFQLVCPKGTGPRQVIFHPFLDFLYCVEEIGNSVSVYSFIPSSGELKMLQRLRASGKTERKNFPSGIATTPDGKFLYVSNRGADTVAVFRLSPAGPMKIEGEFPSCGCFPRHILLTHDTRLLIISNQKSGQVAICPIDATTGRVGKPLDFIHIFQPNCTAEYSHQITK